MKEKKPYKDKYSYDYIVSALERALKTKKLVTINDLCILHAWHKSHWYNVINQYQEEELAKMPPERKITELHSLILLKEEETLKKLCYQSPSSLVFLLKCNFGYDDRPKNDNDSNQIVEALKILGSVKEAVKKELENE